MPDISIGRLRGGFCVYWTDPANGKRHRHQLASRTRKDAEAEASDIYRRNNLKRDEVTITECWETYRGDLGDKPTSQTMRYTGKAILPFFGHYRPDQITRALCLSYATTREKAGLSQGTIHTELGHLRSTLRHAEKLGLIPKSPHIWRPEKPIPKERYLDHDEILRLVDSARAPHIRLAIVLLLGTAGRVGAILDLTWDRIDFDKGIINLRLSDAKTRKGRAIVPMNGMTRAALSSARPAALSDFVIEYAGNPVRSIRTGFIAACNRAGLKDVTIHTLRHSAAVHMAEAGVEMWKISQYLGHSNTAVTEKVYARFAPSAMQDAADVLNFTEIRFAPDQVQ